MTNLVALNLVPWTHSALSLSNLPRFASPLLIYSTTLLHASSGTSPKDENIPMVLQLQQSSPISNLKTYHKSQSFEFVRHESFLCICHLAERASAVPSASCQRCSNGEGTGTTTTSWFAGPSSEANRESMYPKLKLCQDSFAYRPSQQHPNFSSI